jgi:hypothetical protein
LRRSTTKENVMTSFDIVRIVKDNSVRFLKLRAGVAYYAVAVPGEAGEFCFPVPLSDVGGATLEATDKAVLFMRYIRKALDEGTFVRAS